MQNLKVSGYRFMEVKRRSQPFIGRRRMLWSLGFSRPGMDGRSQRPSRANTTVSPC